PARGVAGAGCSSRAGIVPLAVDFGHKRLCRPRPVRGLRLPRVAGLRDRLLLAVGDEDGVVAEALGAPRLAGNPPFQNPCSAKLFTIRAEQNELADVTRAAVGLVAEVAQQPCDRAHALVLAVAGGADSRPAAERGDLDTRVLAEERRARRAGLQPVQSLSARVLVVARLALRRVVVGVERLRLPGQGGPAVPEARLGVDGA